MVINLLLVKHLRVIIKLPRHHYCWFYDIHVMQVLLIGQLERTLSKGLDETICIYYSYVLHTKFD